VSALVAQIVGVSQVPSRLRQALKQLPGVRPLNPSTDLVGGGYTTAQLEYFHLSKPWLIRDVDRDGRLDVVAVIVKPIQSGLEFGVLAVHAKSPDRPQWVVPLGRKSSTASGRVLGATRSRLCLASNATRTVGFDGAEARSKTACTGRENRSRLGRTTRTSGSISSPCPSAAPYVFIALCLAHAQSCGALQGQLKIVGTLLKQRHGLVYEDGYLLDS
jgi:hypothetical protein